MKKRYFLSAIVMMMLMFLIMKIDTKAANILETRTEKGITWILYDDRLLEISGTGKITGDLGYDKHKALVTDLYINEGITSIGEYAFWGFTNLETIDLPDTLTTIEYKAFDDCGKLKNVLMTDSVNEIGSVK